MCLSWSLLFRSCHVEFDMRGVQAERGHFVLLVGLAPVEEEGDAWDLVFRCKNAVGICMCLITLKSTLHPFLAPRVAPCGFDVRLLV